MSLPSKMFIAWDLCINRGSIRSQDIRLFVISNSWNLIPRIVLLLSRLPDIIQKSFCTPDRAMDPTFQDLFPFSSAPPPQPTHNPKTTKNCNLEKPISTTYIKFKVGLTWSKSESQVKNLSISNLTSTSWKFWIVFHQNNNTLANRIYSQQQDTCWVNKLGKY